MATLPHYYIPYHTSNASMATGSVRKNSTGSGAGARRNSTGSGATGSPSKTSKSSQRQVAGRRALLTSTPDTTALQHLLQRPAVASDEATSSGHRSSRSMHAMRQPRGWPGATPQDELAT